MELDNFTVIITSQYNNEILQQLSKMNIRNVLDFSKTLFYADYSNWIRCPKIMNKVSNLLLSDKSISKKYYNLKEKTLKRHFNYEQDNINDIALLLTFELFCREFL